MRDAGLCQRSWLPGCCFPLGLVRCNRMAEAREEYEEALKIFQDFAKQDPEQYTADVQRLKKLLEELPR